ncbi:MAG: flagellar assembly protein FliW [Syntrophales bacterium]
MELKTTRFGTINIDDSHIITMRGPVLGFEKLRRFVIIDRNEEAAFWWLQSVDDGDIVFVVVNPFLIKEDYQPELQEEDIKLLEIEDDSETLLLGIATLNSHPPEITVNVRAPLVVNWKKKLGKQIVLADNSLEVQYRLQVNIKGI